MVNKFDTNKKKKKPPPNNMQDCELIIQIIIIFSIIIYLYFLTECFISSTTSQFCNAGYNTLMKDEYRFANCHCDIFLPMFPNCLDIQETVLRNPCRTRGDMSKVTECNHYASHKYGGGGES